MKTLSLLLVCVFLAVSAVGCAFAGPEGESDPSAASSSQAASAVSAAEEPAQDVEESVSDSSAEENSATDGIVRYDSIYDVPFADLEYENDRNSLSLNGEPWVSAPGTQRFGERCFSDGTTLYIQCFLSDDPEEGFRWFWVCFDHWHENTLEFLPEETYNRLFTHADGYTLYTDDGYQYTVTPCAMTS